MVEGMLVAENLQRFEKIGILADGHLVGGDAEMGNPHIHAVGGGISAGLHRDEIRLRGLGRRTLGLFRKHQHRCNHNEQKDTHDPNKAIALFRPHRGSRWCDHIGRRDQLLLDLLAIAPHLRPAQRLGDVLSAHPCQQGQAAGCPRLVRIQQRLRFGADLHHIAQRIPGSPLTRNRQVLHPYHTLLVQMDCIQPERRCSTSVGLKIDVRLGNPPEDVDETLGLDPLALCGALLQGLAGQQFMGVVAAPVVGARLIDRADERVLHGSHRADIGQEIFHFIRRLILQLLNEDHAPDRSLLGKPGSRRPALGQAFLRDIVAESVVLFAHVFHTFRTALLFHYFGSGLRSGKSGSKFGGSISSLRNSGKSFAGAPAGAAWPIRAARSRGHACTSRTSPL